MDDIDITSERMEAEMPRMIEASRRPVGPKPIGICNFCFHPVGPGLVFCDKDCADDYDREQKAKRRNAA